MNQIRTVFGVVALVIALAAVITNALGILLTAVSGVLAAFSGGNGRIFGVIAIAVNMLFLAFVGPGILYEYSAQTGDFWFAEFHFLFGLQVFAAVFLASVFLWRESVVNGCDAHL